MNIESYLNSSLPIESELKNYLNGENLIIFDVGCCEGEDTIRYSRFFPHSTIYSFEPHPDNFNKTISNLDKYKIKNAKVFNFAISNTDSIIDFYLSEGHPPNVPVTEDWNYGNKSSSILPAKELHDRYDWLRLKNKIQVKSATIDYFCQGNNIDKIDFLHLDVQGAEFLVLEGAKHMLNKISVIWLEAETVELYDGQKLRDDILEFLSNDFKKIKEINNFLSCDILFINKKLYEDINKI
jgi:FkbM family methyltransferase